MTSRLGPGDAAPPFSLTAADGEQLSSADLRGQKAVVYFYPAAGTPGCTAEACDFRDNLASLGAAGYRVVGISPDATGALARFRDAQSLTFPLLADPDHAVHEAYGAWGEKILDGRTVIGPLRSTFVLDAEGKVELALYDVQARGHVAALRERLGLPA